jgi:outer membrane murein-binding lipoprotein Lpp
MRTKHAFYLLHGMILGSLVAGAGPLAAHASAHPAESPAPNTVADSIRELRAQVRELQAAMAEMRSETQRARAETSEIRRELEEVRAQSGPGKPVVMDAVARTEAANQAGTYANAQDEQKDRKKAERGATLDEEYELLSGKIDDQYQTKVESASKYRVRLSGIVLMNLFANSGTVDSIDLPMLAHSALAPTAAQAYPSSVGATLRQSQVGLEVFGPRVGGARTRADLQLDLGGGFLAAPNGVNAGLLRLRTGTMRLDWANTSVVAGQDGLFFSPNSPTSFASLAIPALSYAGNLWAWTPQIRVEHRVTLGEESSMVFQGGILDPLSGEIPNYEIYRQPGPGEASHRPALGTRAAWTHSLFGQPLRVGLGGFFSQQRYVSGQNVDAWAGMTDIELPLSHQFSLSGKLYRGKGLGGLYGGLGRSVLFSGDPTSSSTAVRALNTAGGWAQLKYRPASKLEFNGAFGLDNSYAADLRAFPFPQAYGDPSLARNSGSFVNVIFRPRSDLLFSAEYRHLRTYMINSGPDSATHLNLTMGVLF